MMNRRGYLSTERYAIEQMRAALEDEHFIAAGERVGLDPDHMAEAVMYLELAERALRLAERGPTLS